MSFIELFILAVGLSMDAFAVSVCKGLAVQRVTLRECSLAGVWFGGFQALMPTIGYFLGRYFTRYIESLDHWVAFILLAVIGGNMIRESFGVNEGVEVCLDESLRRFDTVYPAAGSAASAVRLSPDELARCSAPCTWVDVCKIPEADRG